MNKKLEILLIILIVIDGAMLILKSQISIIKPLQILIDSVFIALLLIYLILFLASGKKDKNRTKKIEQEKEPYEEEKLE